MMMSFTSATTSRMRTALCTLHSRSDLTRLYVSRAHPPKTIPSYSISEALSDILQGIEERKERREQKWKRNEEKRIAKGMKDDGPFRNQDETIEMALNLNLDPRKPGQALRGSVSLPHGSGKKLKIVVFTTDEETSDAVLEAGARTSGGADLVQQIASGEIPVNFDRALASPDMMPSLSKIARILGPRGLMPNAKLGTIQQLENMVDAVKEQSKGMVQYRTDKNGIIHAGVGKASFTQDEILDNIKSFMNQVQDVKPESYGKGKKSSGGGSKKKGGGGSKKAAQYYLKAHITSTFGKSINLDLRTVDPTSTWFMAEAPE